MPFNSLTSFSALFVRLTVYAALTVGANAHHDVVQRSARQHFYDFECCSDRDCYPVDRSFIQWTPAGWLITDTGQVIPELDANGAPNPNIRISKDTQNHICRPSDNLLGQRGSGTVICIYIASSGN